MSFNLSRNKIDLDRSNSKGAWVTLPCGVRVHILSARSDVAVSTMQDQMRRDAVYIRASKDGKLPKEKVHENTAEILSACLIGWDSKTMCEDGEGGEPTELKYTKKLSLEILSDPTNEILIEQLNFAVADRSHFMLGTEDDLKN